MPFPNIRHWFLPQSSPSPSPVDAETSESSAHHIQEQINPTALASSPTQEDWYWGRLATGDEEDYYWRRLSDNWYQKDVIGTTFSTFKDIEPAILAVLKKLAEKVG